MIEVDDQITDIRICLGRIDERLKVIEAQTAMILAQNALRKCAENSEKLRTHERLIWGALGSAGSAFVGMIAMLVKGGKL